MTLEAFQQSSKSVHVAESLKRHEMNTVGAISIRPDFQNSLIIVRRSHIYKIKVCRWWRLCRKEQGKMTKIVVVWTRKIYRSQLDQICHNWTTTVINYTQVSR